MATALDVQKRFGDLRGGNLAAAVTLNIFLSVFPLLLVAIALLGFVTNHNTSIINDIISGLGLNSEASKVVRDAIDTARGTRKSASVFGFLGLLWSSLGVFNAVAYALDVTWQAKGRSIKDRATGGLWLIGAGFILGTSIALTSVVAWLAKGLLLAVLAAFVSLLINFVFWLWTFVVLNLKKVTWKAYIPGSILGALGLEGIKQIGTVLPGLFSGSSALYGSIGAVFAIISTLLLFSRLLVYASVLNVIKWEHSHGTTTVKVEAPNVPADNPTDADRSGATEVANSD